MSDNRSRTKDRYSRGSFRIPRRCICVAYDRSKLFHTQSNRASAEVCADRGKEYILADNRVAALKQTIRIHKHFIFHHFTLKIVDFLNYNTDF